MIRVPTDLSSLAHSMASDVSRVRTTLSGVTTRPAVLRAENDLKRMAESVRMMRSQVRVLKRAAV